MKYKIFYWSVFTILAMLLVLLLDPPLIASFILGVLFGIAGYNLGAILEEEIRGKR